MKCKRAWSKPLLVLFISLSLGSFSAVGAADLATDEVAHSMFPTELFQGKTQAEIQEEMPISGAYRDETTPIEEIATVEIDGVEKEVAGEVVAPDEPLGRPPPGQYENGHRRDIEHDLNQGMAQVCGGSLQDRIQRIAPQPRQLPGQALPLGQGVLQFPHVGIEPGADQFVRYGGPFLHQGAAVARHGVIQAPAPGGVVHGLAALPGPAKG